MSDLQSDAELEKIDTINMFLSLLYVREQEEVRGAFHYEKKKERFLGHNSTLSTCYPTAI